MIINLIIRFVMDILPKLPFTLKEAAEYLEVAEITVRRWVKSKNLMARKIGRNIVLSKFGVTSRHLTHSNKLTA